MGKCENCKWWAELSCRYQTTLGEIRGKCAVNLPPWLAAGYTRETIGRESCVFFERKERD